MKAVTSHIPSVECGAYLTAGATQICVELNPVKGMWAMTVEMDLEERPL